MTTQAFLEQTKPASDYPSMYCNACGQVVTLPELGVVGGCPYCKTQRRWVGPLWSEEAPLITVASGMPKVRH